MNIKTLDELKEKLSISLDTYEMMIVQEQIRGDEIRIEVLGDQVIVAYKRIPPTVTGDGVSPIMELIQAENDNNPHRGDGYFSILSKILVNDELFDCLSKQNLNTETVLPKGKIIQVRSNSNVGSGGTLEEVTNILHRETAKMCVHLARKMGLTFAGIDVMTTDISRPLHETGGVILEANATPGIGGVREVTSKNPARLILEYIFSH